MTKEQLKQFKKWFDDYVGAFYGSDEMINENIALKDNHTRRMCEDIKILTAGLKINENEKLLAETAVLFHDVGRFEQFMKYKAYNDVGTENHSLLALKILAENKVLDCLNKNEKEIIEKAIRFHGDKELPKNLDEQTELIAKLVRDCDKLDIYVVSINWLGNIRKNPNKYLGTLGLSAENKYSKKVVEAVLHNKTISYRDFKTNYDLSIAQLGWIIDINFIATLKEIKKRRLLEQLVTFLPDTQEIQQVLKHVQNLLDRRIKEEK